MSSGNTIARGVDGWRCPEVIRKLRSDGPFVGIGAKRGIGLVCVGVEDLDGVRESEEDDGARFQSGLRMVGHEVGGDDTCTDESASESAGRTAEECSGRSAGANDGTVFDGVPGYAWTWVDGALGTDTGV